MRILVAEGNAQDNVQVAELLTLACLKLSAFCNDNVAVAKAEMRSS